VFKTKVQKVSTESTPPAQSESTQNNSSVFSDAEVRVRAYQIYESRDRNLNQAEQDWSQAEIELTEMLGGK
jgi:hypothetical protein